VIKANFLVKLDSDTKPRPVLCIRQVQCPRNVVWLYLEQCDDMPLLVNKDRVEYILIKDLVAFGRGTKEPGTDLENPA